MYILDTISLNSLKVENNRAAFSSSFGKYIVKKEFYQKLKKEEEKLQSGIFLILDYEKDKRRIETLIKEFPLYLKRWTGDKTIDKNESLLLALGKERSSEKIPSLYCIPRRIVQLTDFYILKNDSIVQDIQKMTTDNVKEREENKLFEFLGELSSQYSEIYLPSKIVQKLKATFDDYTDEEKMEMARRQCPLNIEKYKREINKVSFKDIKYLVEDIEPESYRLREENGNIVFTPSYCQGYATLSLPKMRQTENRLKCMMERAWERGRRIEDNHVFKIIDIIEMLEWEKEIDPECSLRLPEELVVYYKKRNGDTRTISDKVANYDKMQDELKQLKEENKKLKDDPESGQAKMKIYAALVIEHLENDDTLRGQIEGKTANQKSLIRALLTLGGKEKPSSESTVRRTLDELYAKNLLPEKYIGCYRKNDKNGRNKPK